MKLFEIGAKLDGDSWDTKKEKNSSVQKIVSKNKHQLVFTFEKRRGKAVTLVGRFYIDEKEKREILKLLKKNLACGGTVNEEWIEIQGDVKDKIKSVLESNGWKFRK